MRQLIKTGLLMSFIFWASVAMVFTMLTLVFSWWVGSPLLWLWLRTMGIWTVFVLVVFLVALHERLHP